MSPVPHAVHQLSGWKWSPGLRFSILFIISLAVWGSSLIASLALALRDDQYTHLLLILPVSVALIEIGRASCRERVFVGV
jgi:hypothetical protein